jgi:hypothetical protein
MASGARVGEHLRLLGSRWVTASLLKPPPSSSPRSAIQAIAHCHKLAASHEINRPAEHVRLFARLLVREHTQVKQSESHQVRDTRGQFQPRAANGAHSLKQADLGRWRVQPDPARYAAEMPRGHHAAMR